MSSEVELHTVEWLPEMEICIPVDQGQRLLEALVGMSREIRQEVALHIEEDPVWQCTEQWTVAYIQEG